jgi:hypothetical protein
MKSAGGSIRHLNRAISRLGTCGGNPGEDGQQLAVAMQVCVSSQGNLYLGA